MSTSPWYAILMSRLSSWQVISEHQAIQPLKSNIYSNSLQDTQMHLGNSSYWIIPTIYQENPKGWYYILSSRLFLYSSGRRSHIPKYIIVPQSGGTNNRRDFGRNLFRFSSSDIPINKHNKISWVYNENSSTWNTTDCHYKELTFK